MDYAVTISAVAEELRQITREVANEVGLHPEDIGYRDVVKDNGLCLYVHPGQDKPACIIGHWLHRKGVPLANLREMENLDCLHVLHVQRHLMPNVPTEVASYLRLVQMGQDDDIPWMLAISRPLRYSQHMEEKKA